MQSESPFLSENGWVVQGQERGSGHFSGFHQILFWILFFIFDCTGASLLQAGYSSSCGKQTSHCFSSCWARALRCMGFSSCGSWTQLPYGMWNLPQPEIKPVSPALAGGFLTTGPSGTSHWVFSDLKKTTLQASDKLFWWIPWPQFPQMKNKECGLNSTPRRPRKFQEWVWGTALCSSSTKAAIFYLLPKFCFDFIRNI